MIRRKLIDQLITVKELVAGIAVFLFLITVTSSVADELDSLPDPTMPFNTVPTPTEGPAKASKLTLQTIVVSPGNTYALINGERVTEGGYIEGIKVESINSFGIVVISQGQRKVLTLAGQDVVKQR